MTDTPSRLRSCFQTVFPDLREEEIPEASMDSVEAWDSLASVTLMSVVEEEFGLQVPPEDLERFTSFESVLDYLQRDGSPQDASGTRR
jgi:acyl carrier protein